MNFVDEILNNQRSFLKENDTFDLNFRINNLKKLKKILLENEDDLLDSLYLDLNKSKFEAYSSEFGLVLDEIDFTIKNLKNWSKKKRVKTNLINFKSKSYILREPYGNVLIVSPWNYPILLALSPLIGAIAGGNTVILKPSEKSRHTSKTLERILNNNFDSSYIAVILGDKDLSKYVTSRRFDYIFFTGSPRVGKSIMKNASEYLTPVTLELGGKSPAIIDNNIDLNLAAKRLVFGKFLNSGQTCVAPDYILVKNLIKEEFVEKLIRQIETMTLKNIKDYPKIIDQINFERLLSLIEDENIVYGGKNDLNNLKIYPTLVLEPDLNGKLMNEEIFGPILPIIGYDSEDELIDFINEKEKPLALYIFSNNQNFIDKLHKKISFGGGCVNDTVMHLTNPNMPFGGVGNSGMGGYHGKWSFDTFTHEKSILDKSTIIDIPLRYPPFKNKLALIKKILK